MNRLTYEYISENQLNALPNAIGLQRTDDGNATVAIFFQQGRIVDGIAVWRSNTTPFHIGRVHELAIQVLGRESADAVRNAPIYIRLGTCSLNFP